MKLIFECETELGRCDVDRINGHFGEETDDWIAFALTTAAVTGAKGMLRIEQRCYLRSAGHFENLRSQGWVKPEMTLEPVSGLEEETLQTVQRLHEQFLQRARNELTEQSVITNSGSLSNSPGAAGGGGLAASERVRASE